jgi:hypothetical protein
MEITMRVNVDFPIFSSDTEAFGNCSGTLDLVELPAVGDSISFAFCPVGMQMPQCGFDGFLKVVSRRFDVGSDVACSLELSDIYVDGVHLAQALMEYFEGGFGLTGYSYQR